MTWKQKGLGLVAAGIALVLMVGLAFYTYFLATMQPLHPDPQAVTSVRHVAPPAKWTDAVERAKPLVRAHLTQRNVPGLSVAVGVGGELVWSEGFGWADLEKQLPVTPDTVFRIGSVSTALTSAAAGLLMEQGRLNLDEEVQAYVPTFPKKEWPVTLRQLMGHTGGVRHFDDEEFMPRGVCEKTLDGLAIFADDPLVFEPGSRFRFSTFGWILVSAALETAAKEPILTFMRRQIFEPLGMSGTAPDSATAPPADRATLYWPRVGEDPRYGYDTDSDADYSCFSGAGAFLSTPSDLVKFAMALANGKLLKSETMKLLQTSQRLTSGEESEYGLGWGITTVPLAGEPTRVIGHGRPLLPEATLMGGSTSLITIPDRGITVSVTSNMSSAETSNVAVGIAEVFAEQAKSPIRK